jgi:hypothetical protein
MRFISVRKFATVAAAAISVVALTSGSAIATVSDSSDPAVESARILAELGYDNSVESLDGTETVDFSTTADGGQEIRIQAASINVVCKGSPAVRDPHYSIGAGGAIYKTVLSCTGTGASSVSVRVQGLLTFGQAASQYDVDNVKFVTRGTSDQTQVIQVNGASKTYYTPKVGSNGGTGKGFWRATSTWYISSPIQGTVGSQTVTIFENINKM